MPSGFAKPWDNQLDSSSATSFDIPDSNAVINIHIESFESKPQTNVDAMAKSKKCVL